MAEDHSPLRLLSLDGGGIRGYSTLLLLKAVFEELEDIQGHPTLPCEVFDMIAGTSTGGLIAVMLGPLRMDIKDCINAYLDMAPKVFPVEHRIKRSKPAVIYGLWRGKKRFDAKPLEIFLQEMIAKNVAGRSQEGKDTTLRFEANKGGPNCKIFLCAKSKKFGRPFRFRNYRVPGDTIPDCPLWQACRATSAAPTIFPPIEIGKAHVRYVDGGMGANNPIEELVDEARSLWKNKRDIGCILSVGTGVPAMTDIGTKLRELLEALVAMATNTQDIHINFLKKVMSSYGIHQYFYFRINVEHGLENVSLEEWKHIESIDVATGSYINANREVIRACARTLIHPIAPPPLTGIPHRWPRYMVFEDHCSENFVQRKQYSDRIENTFRQVNGFRHHVAIYGLPGMGKSQLVYDYVRENHGNYLTVFATDASRLENIGASFNLFFEELGLPKCYEDDQGHRVIAVLQWLRRNSQWLLIFDNVQEKHYNRLKKYLPQGDCGHIMITTRSEWVGKTFGSGPGNLTLHVEEMKHDTAIELLLKSSQLQERGKELQVIELASDLVQELWHVPLTIEFVGKGHRSEQKLMAVLAVLKNTTKREEFIAAYQQEDEPLGYDQKTADGTTTFITLYMIGSVSQAAQQLWSVMAFLDPSWYAESLFQMIHSAADVPLGHIVSNREALSEYFGELYALGFISSTQDKDGYWTHDQLQLVARVSLRKTAGKQIEYASIAASWVSKAFPNYNTFQKKWVHNKEYLTHALTCIGYCEQLRIQTPDLQKLYYKSSNYARFIGNYPTAESLGKRATETFDPSTGDRHDYFRARESFALALRRVSKFDEAIAILRESLKQQEQDLEQDDPDTLSMLNELGWAIFLKGGVEDAKEAEPILREAMIRREKRLGPEAGATQHTYQNLATCLAKLERYKEAESLYKLAFEGHVKLFGTEDQHWVQHIKGNIAKMYEAQGKLEKAMDLFRGVMEWREKNVNFGLKHPDTLRVALSLARVYHKLGRHNDAMELARKTRSSYAKTFGEDHAETKGIDAWIEEIRLRRNGHDNEMSGA